MDHDFDLFDFAAAQAAREEAAAPVPPSERVLGKRELQQAAFAFLSGLKPSGIAANVPTRRSKYKVAAAAFWRPERSRRGMEVERTALVVMYDDADSCFSDCSGREERIAAIRELQTAKAALEAEIRRTEPHLAAADDLFSEFRTWDYAASTNREYHRLRRRLDREIKLLTQGSKLEYIRRAGNADLCYLAVPAGLIDPGMIPAEWGIVELTPAGRRFRLAREARMLDNVTPAGRLALALNIAQTAAGAERFCAGVDADGGFRKPPRRRGKLRSLN
ncbi:MAG: hypothetical protein MR051_08190 [Lentisphaeria bacterium]|nr:hypothetical protein [Lentisphaeria bacterium]